MNPGLKITDEMLDAASRISDIDEALRTVMDVVGIDDGGVAAMALSHVESDWPHTTPDQRRQWLNSWRNSEIHYGDPEGRPLHEILEGPMSTEEYVDEPGRCPHCRGDNIEGGFVNIDNGTASQPISCNDCDATWVDTYTLTGYTELETP